MHHLGTVLMIGKFGASGYERSGGQNSSFPDTLLHLYNKINRDHDIENPIIYIV